MAELRWGIATDTGQVRAENEDHVFAAPSLFVVADGMGGHQAGEIASQLAVQHLEARLTDDTPTIDDLVTAINDANRDIYSAALSNPDHQGMGTTITSMAVMDDPHDGEVFALANVGDSRTYLFRHGRLRQLTIDHSYVQELVSEGYISSDEARNHPRRNIVTRALGIESSVRVDSWTMPIIRGDRFLLCSDGLVDEVHDDQIALVLRDLDDPQAAAEELVRLANANGGRDNVSVVVVDVLEGDDPPDPTEEFDVIPAWAGDAPGETDDGGEGGDGDGGEALTASDPDSGVGEPSGDDAAPEGVTSPTSDVAGDLATPTGPVASGAGPGDPPVRRSGRLARFVIAVATAAVLILGFTIFAAWARDGFFVAFDDTDEVVIFRGRQDSVLWFDPTVEARTVFARDTLDADSIARVEATPRFETLSSAEAFVRERLTTTTTTTTTTVPPTTAPVTTAPVTTTSTTTTSGTTTSGNTSGNTSGD